MATQYLPAVPYFLPALTWWTFHAKFGSLLGLTWTGNSRKTTATHTTSWSKGKFDRRSLKKVKLARLKNNLIKLNLITEMFLKSGRLLHHLTILYKRWSAMLHRLAIRSGLLSLEMPALDKSGLDANDALLPGGAGWLSRESSAALYCHKCSTSIISWKTNLIVL